MYDALALMAQHDDARKVILEGRASRETRVDEVMSRDVVTVAPERTVQECMGRMTEHRIRHLPVVRDGELIGIVSIGDVVEATIAQ